MTTVSMAITEVNSLLTSNCSHIFARYCHLIDMYIVFPRIKVPRRTKSTELPASLLRLG